MRRKLRVTLLAILVLGLIAEAQAQTARPPATPPKIEAFLKQCETSRRGAILQLEYKLRGLKSDGSKSLETMARAARIEKDLRALRSNKEPVVPAISFPPEIGAIGRLPRLTCHVEQVISDQEMLIRCVFPVTVATVRHFQAHRETVEQAVLFLIRGVSTKDVHEGADVEMLQVLEISGREGYKTVDGESRTVGVLREFDMTAFEPYFRDFVASQK
jgi:hypothetical protein